MAGAPQATKVFSAARCAPEFGEKKAGGQSSKQEQRVEEEVDECVHAREQNTGGRTSAGGGRKNPGGTKAEFEA